METPTRWTSTEYLALHQSKNTRTNYKVALKQFFSLIYQTDIPPKDGDEIVNNFSSQYLSEDRDHDKDAVAYFQSMAHYAPTSRAFKFSVLKSWLEVNGIILNSGVIRTLNGKKAVESITEEYIPKDDDLKKILKHLPIQARSVVLVILSSGMRPGEPFKLQFGDIDMESYPTKVSLRGSSTKSGKKRWTYISPQAKQELESWLSFRDQFIESKLRYGGVKESQLIFPFSTQSFGALWVRALKKSGLYKMDEATGRTTMRPHNLRKYFATHGKFGDRDIAQFLMGHTGALRKVYVRYDQVEETVQEAYVKAIPSLTIGEGFADTEAVQKLEEKIEVFEESKIENSDNINYVLKMNRALSAEVDELRTQVNSLVKWMEQEINSRAVLKSGGAVETIHVTEEEARADLQEKKKAF